MAIIYTYPVKTTPADADKILISDSEDDNKTKSVTIEDIRSATVSGVSSIIAGDNITLPSGSTGDVEIDAATYTAGDGIDINSYVVSTDLKANSGLVIDTTELSLDLSASAIEGTLAVKDGGTGAETFTAGFLKANGTNAFTTVAQIDLSTDVTDGLSVTNGGTGATTLTGVLVGNGTSAITGGGDINDLANAQFSTAANGSLYLGNIPSGLSGSPAANLIAGNGAGNLLTTGSSNILMGNKAGDVLTTGDANTIIGVLVGNGTSAITGGGDINDLANAQFSTAANGSLYLGNIPSGLSGSPAANLIAGNGAGNLLTTGSSNILMGNKAGDVLTTGDANTIIGANADSSAAGNDSGVGIGQGISVGDAGIAIGRAASAGDNELAIASASYPITLDATSRDAGTFLPVKINGTQYYIQLYVA